MIFLMGLNESFANVRGNILLQEPLPDISKVYSHVLQDEKQRSLNSPSCFKNPCLTLIWYEFLGIFAMGILVDSCNHAKLAVWMIVVGLNIHTCT